MTSDVRSGLWALGFALVVHSPQLRAQSKVPRAQSPVDTPTIVFVCEHGTVKSVLALVYFESMVRERGLAFRAISRGTAPDSALPPFMRARLRADGLDIGAFTPTRFSERDLTAAVRVVSFDAPTVANLVAGRVPTATWDKLPSVTVNYAVARDSIRNRVAKLVDSLAKVRSNIPY